MYTITFCEGHTFKVLAGIMMLTFILLVGGAGASTFTPSGSDYAGVPDAHQIIGRLEANGTHFELNNSSYLNITLDSSETIQLVLESAPEMVTMHLESASGATSAQITLSGFLPLTTYHKYEDNYHNHVVFTTDGQGNYTYTQDLSTDHLVFIQPRASTKFIRDDATGGDCTSIGTWNSATKTCKLTTDLFETVQIDSDGITLDGNGHAITGSETGIGVFLTGRTGININNLKVEKFVIGIYLWNSSNNKLGGNIASNNGNDGIILAWSNNNTLSGNIASSNNRYGIFLVAFSSNNTLNGNIASYNNIHGILLEPNNNMLINNNASNNKYTGIALSYLSSNNTLSDNIVSYNMNGIVMSPLTSNNTLSSNTALNNNQYGIYLYSSSSSNMLSSNTALNNYYGVYLENSINNNLTGNTANSNYGAGIYLINSGNNLVGGNNLTGNTANLNYGDGIKIRSLGNNLAGNTANSNHGWAGIHLDCIEYRIYLTGNNLTGNIANSNQGAGISLGSCAAGGSYNNNLNGNTANLNYGNGISLMRAASNNNLTGNTANSNYRAGFAISGANNNNLSSNNASNNNYGIIISPIIHRTYSSDNNVTGNIFLNNSIGIILSNETGPNTIYNNLFNNTNNYGLGEPRGIWNWNTTKTLEKNIVGGPYIGGNFWAQPDGNGYSQKCVDSNRDGICDLPYTLNDNNVDYLPLSMDYNIFGGILQPINADGTSVFKLGSTIPVKFQLKDTKGNFVTNAIAKIYLVKTGEAITGKELEAISTSAATTGNLFRYDSTANQYIFNLGTKTLSTGTWQIRIELNDGTSNYVKIGLR